MSSNVLNFKLSFDLKRRIYSWLAIGLALFAIAVSGNGMTIKNASHAHISNGAPIKEKKTKEKRSKGFTGAIKHGTVTAGKKTGSAMKTAGKKTGSATKTAGKKTGSATKTAVKKITHRRKSGKEDKNTKSSKEHRA